MSKSIYVVFGGEALLRSEAVSAIVGEELGGAGDSLGVTRMEGDRSGAADVLDEVRTFSLLGDRRVVIVEDADGFVTRHREALERYCGAPCESGCLILSCESFDARTRLYKAIERVGQVVRCEAPRGRAVEGWIVRRAREKYGKAMVASSAARLRELAGDSLGVLDSELSKLATYVGSRAEVTVPDVEALVGCNREQTVFAVLDAMASGDAPGALRHWEQVLATDRAAPGRAIGGLAWGIRRLAQAKQAVAEGVPLPQLARQFWTDPAVLRRRLERVTPEDLEDQLSELLAADLASKSGLGTVASEVEKFIVRHAAGGRAGGQAVAGGRR